MANDPSTIITVKDLVSIAVGSAALLTSITVAALNYHWQKDKKASDARADLEKLRLESGEKFNDPNMFSRRVLLQDKITFYLSRALQCLKTKDISASSFDNLLVAAALIDSGRREESIAYYKKSVDLSADAYERANGQRVYGRALILTGDLTSGRNTMLSAISAYRQLADDEGFDADKLNGDAADACRRLILAQKMKGFDEFLNEDENLFQKIVCEIRDPVRRTFITNLMLENQKSFLSSEPSASPGGLR